MVRGLELFRERFRAYEHAFVLIGGAACDAWFTAQGLSFRATKDLDIVLLIEVLDDAFVAAMRSFVDEGGYQIRQRTNGTSVLYRFARPMRESYPFMLELFCSGSQRLSLAEGQTVIPVEVEPDHHSLSAILLDPTYYGIIQSESEVRDGLRFATAASLIPLKARAWLDLVARKANGDEVDTKDIDKHRNDVFRLAATLPGEPGPRLAEPIINDLSLFLSKFPEEHADWPRILVALAATVGRGLRAKDLREAIVAYFGLPST
jgi:hypothetical protein